MSFADAPQRVVVLSGPSGVGKSTLLAALRTQRPDVHCTISATTRQPRVGEIAGHDYHFLSRADFLACVAEEKMLEHAEYTGNLYGTLRSEVRPERTTLIECEVEGALQLRATLPGALQVFILPPSLRELEQRLSKRGSENARELRARLDRAVAEIAYAPGYDYRIVCSDTAATLGELLALLPPPPPAQQS